MIRRLVYLALALRVYAQPAKGPDFEVASIKPSPAPGLYGYSSIGCRGGPGSDDAGRFRCVNMSLSGLVSGAYDLKPYEFSGPDWMSKQIFDLVAKVPAGTTKEQFHLMQQNLLADRFKLAVHRDQKEMAVYEMVVVKGGAKFKRAADHPEESKPFAQLETFKRDKEGFPEIPVGVSTLVMMGGGKTRMTGFAQTMAEFARRLTPYAQRPLIDATGLAGNYDFDVHWVADSGRVSDQPDGPDFFSALQSQLGLKLEPKRGMVPVLVVDRAERTPTEN